MNDFGSAHERHLAAYRRETVMVWCSNKQCEFHQAEQWVMFETEYGQGWLTPEECPRCHSEWQEDEPKEDEE